MKTVVITGSSRGLGFEMAKKFKIHGFNVVICGRNLKNLEKAIDEINSIQSEGKVKGVQCDVSVLTDVEKLLKEASETFGNIDIWINNAGVNQSYRYIWELEGNEIDFLFNVDLKGTINGSSVAMRKMIEQGSGAIYNVEGLGSNDAFQPCFSLYGTSKRAVTYFTDALANEINVKKLPIVAGKLSPGMIITDFLTSSNGQQKTITLDEKLKKVYNILGDRPDTIAEFLVEQILKNTKNGKRISWLTNRKAAFRFMTASFNKRDFFS